MDLSDASGTTMDEIIARLTRYPASDLEPIMRAVLYDDSASLAGGHHCESAAGLSFGRGTLAIVKVHGNAQTITGIRPWSVVVKAMEIRDSDQKYGSSGQSVEREAFAYQLDVLTNAGTGMRAARCYRIEHHPGDQVWIWIEDLSGWNGPPWNSADYSRACLNVGQFSGYWAVNAPPVQSLPQHIGVDRFIWSNMARLADLDSAAELDELLRGVLPHSSYRASEKLGVAVDGVRDTVLSGERIFVHGDCHPRNLYLSQKGASRQETVAIDWANIGLGPIATDVGTLAGSGMTWKEDEFHMVVQSESEFFEAFFDGLARGGWQGERRVARLNFLAFIFGYGMYLGEIAALIANEGSNRDFFFERSGEETAEVAFRSFAARAETLEPLAAELLELSK